MNLVSSLLHLFVQDGEAQHSNTPTIVIITTTVAATLSSVALINRLLHPKRPTILPGPLKTFLPNLPPQQQQQQQQQEEEESSSSLLVYPPDYFPGARDVSTPYGSMRCYEWGPTQGRKVLLLHGISTSCMTLTYLAHGLVERGCRVLLFDLFGRGFSDAVGDLPYDERLYVSQALCVLASSELAWTGAGGCDVLGYSLGGGIAVHLAGAFPAMVRSVVLLAPAGLIRAETFGWASRVVFRSGWVPERLLEVLTRWRLKRPIAASAKKRKPGTAAANNNGNDNGRGKGGKGGKPTTTNTNTESSALLQQPHLPGDKTIEATITSEIADPSTPDPPNALQKKVLAFVGWQANHHAGFINAFQSTVRHAPLLYQYEAYRKLAARPPKTVCFIFGDGDGIVNEEDYRQDALPLVGGEDHVVWRKSVRGAHDFPMVDPETTLRLITEFWAGV